ncbi:manganese efflux pump MntP family protein [Candidatus Eisenbacteria bacterium]|uniref:Putative manganese efflux pump MntP n=1 Tax=Eiseniibacteriota bacterium TaxID=2212470 RepID=A0ABV6YIM0_UNCEI
MGNLEILLLAIALAMDAFAVSVGAGACGYAKKLPAAARMAVCFGLAQALMPLLGWLAGSEVVRWIEAVDHWVAFGLLAAIGGRMIIEGLRPVDACGPDPSCGSRLLVMSLATSIDAFVAGVSLAMIAVNIVLACVVIGVVTMILSLIGVRLGVVLRAVVGRRMEIVGGLVLIAIGLRILVLHLSS